jgi:CO/xanthine dehydrogenase FAD-binding subunit
MKPAPFDYAAPTTVEEAVALLARAPAETRVLAGGQSLMPRLNLRELRPAQLVDLGRVAGLDAIERDGERLRIGAMVRLRTLGRDATIAAALPLLPAAVAHVAHAAVRSRGTLGGSLAHADPAAELPAAVVTLDAVVVLRGAEGERRVPAAQLFRGPFATAIRSGELLVAVELPIPPEGTGAAFEEVARIPGGPAQAGAAALVRLGGDGRVAAARLTLSAVGPGPVAVEAAGELVGAAPDAERIARVAERAGAALDPPQDPTYRRTLAVLLAARALTAAAERARRTA